MRRKCPSLKVIQPINLVLPGVILLFFSGNCSKPLVGDWKTDSTARGDPFYLSSASFKEDGSYSAKAWSTGLILTLTGAYQFDGLKLTLKAPGKPDLVFAVRFQQSGQTLELSCNGQKMRMKKNPFPAR